MNDEIAVTMKNFNTSGYVYFIRKEGQDIFKIGMTRKSPEDRLSVIQISSSDKLILYGVIHSDHARKLEARLHDHCGKHKLSGEWFSLTEKDVNLLLDDYGNVAEKKVIELIQGRNKYYYVIDTSKLWVDIKALRSMGISKLSQMFLLSISTTAYFSNGVTAIRYDDNMEHFSRSSEDRIGHKERLLLGAKEFVDNAQFHYT